jgi:N-acyl-D-amino-acid deacylase
VKLLATFPLVILLSAPGSEHAGAAGSAPADTINRRGIVIDGSGAKGRRADVVIAGGRIVRVGNAAGFESVQVIEARGLAVAPGFIDVHTHADRLADQPLAENYIRMGVTSIVAGNCGDSTVDIGEAYRRIRATGPSVNFATLIGHNSIRAQVLGNERRAPTASELSRMKELVVRAMAEGAVGLSTGLQYVPGVYASPEEIIELAKVAAEAGGIYASHIRNEGTDIERALAETLRVGEATGCAVEVSHLKIDSPRRWGNAPRVLAMLEAARRRGIVRPWRNRTRHGAARWQGVGPVGRKQERQPRG